MALLISDLVNEDMTLSQTGWDKATKLAAKLPDGLTVPAQWAILFLASEQLGLDKDEDMVLFFLSITRKIYTGDIVRNTIDVLDLL